MKEEPAGRDPRENRGGRKKFSFSKLEKNRRLIERPGCQGGKGGT